MMTEQEKRKLKNKLAMWVGWHEEKYEITRGAFALVLLAPSEELSEGHIGYIPEHTPNFPDSLDACFGWFAPKLDDIGEHYLIFQRAVWNEPNIKSVTISFVSLELDDMEGQGENYALALCLAVEKFIDGGAKNANK